MPNHTASPVPPDRSRRSCLVPAVVSLLAGSLGVVFADPAGRSSGQQVSFTFVAPGLAAPGAVDYQVSTESFVVVVRPSARGRSLEMVTPDGDRYELGSASGIPPDAPVALAQDEIGAQEGEIFTTRGVAGEIVRSTSDGKLTAQAWVRLPGETGTVTALAFSHGGPSGFDLIAGTSSGNLWRVATETVHPVLLAALGKPVRAVLPLPAVPSRYGDASGAVLAALGEPGCQVVSVDALGRPSVIDASGCVIDLDLIVPGADAFFTGTAEVEGKTLTGVLKADADGFASSTCNVLAVRAKGPLSVLGWSAGTPYSTRAGSDAVTITASAFAGASIACQPEVCGDVVDNNANGETDEDCVEACGDGVDNNSNGDVDEGCPEVCGDGEDNDGNGVVDDGCVEICGDGADNDNDDLTDAPCPEICADGIDNDLNGAVDDGCPPRPADAGCRPDRWLANRSAWVGLDPGEPVGGVFVMPSGDPFSALAKERLEDLLKPAPSTLPEKPRTMRALLSAGLAGLLSGSQPLVSYPIPPALVAEQVRLALASGSLPHVGALTSVLEAYNALGCSLPAKPPAKDK